MSGFNPDRYLDEKKPPFDPNAYLSQKTGKVPPKPGMEDISAGDTFLANLAPKGVVSAAYGAAEAAPGVFTRPFAETLARYRKERDYAKDFLDESKKQNPRSALAGKVVGTTPFAVAAGPEIAAQGLLGGALSAAESDADLTRLDDEAERQKFGRDVGTGLITGTVLGGAARYAPVTTATVGTGALAGGLATGDDRGAAVGAGLGLLTRGGMAAANPVTREAVKNLLFKPYEVSPNAPAIIEAAERQGISRDALPGYLLTENEEAKRSADALLKSGRLGGGLMRKEIEPVRTVLKEGTDNLLADATPKTAYEVGTAVQKGVRSKAEGLLEPIAAEYEALDTKFGGADASSRSVRNVGKKIAALKSEPGLGPEARSILGEVERDIGNVKTIGDLKKIRTNLNNQLKRDGQGNVISDKNAIRVVSELNDAFTKARENSIKLSGKKVTYDLSRLPVTSKEVPDVGQMSPLLLRERLSRGEIINVGDFEIIPTGSSKGNRVSVYKNGQLITRGAKPGMNSDDIGVAELPALLAKHDKAGALGSELEASLNTPTQGRPQPGSERKMPSMGGSPLSRDTEEILRAHAKNDHNLGATLLEEAGDDDVVQKAVEIARDQMEAEWAESSGYTWDEKNGQYVHKGSGQLVPHDEFQNRIEDDPDFIGDFNRRVGKTFKEIYDYERPKETLDDLFAQADQKKRSVKPSGKETNKRGVALDVGIVNASEPPAGHVPIKEIPFSGDKKASEILAKADKANPDWKFGINDLPTEKIPKDKFVAMQPWMDPESVSKYQSSQSKLSPIVIKEGDKYYVAQGHHRLIADIRNGKSEITARIVDVGSSGDRTPWTPIALPKKTVTTTFWDGALESNKFPTVGKVADKNGGVVKKIGEVYFRKLKNGIIVVADQDGEVLGQWSHEELPGLISALDENGAGIAADLAKKGFKIPKRVEYDRAAILNQRAVDAKYRGTIKDIEAALPYGSKGGKGGLLPVEKLERVQPEKVRESLGLFTDRDTREGFTKTFPSEAELVRRAELAKIKGSTTPPQGDEQRNPKAVLNELFGSPRGTPRYDEEALIALLKDKKLTADDLKTIAAALPQNYNPSGTSNQATFMEALMNPRESIGSYLAKKKLDLKTPNARGLLKGKPDAGRVGKAEEAIRSLFEKTGKGLLRKDDRR